MPARRLECPNCGGQLAITSDGKIGLCHACDSKFMIEDDVVKHTVEGHITIDGLTTKKQLLNRAEQLMQEGNYASASALYHQVIDQHDALDSDAWWGLARASVDDFSRVERLITREQLGKNYRNAIEYATADKRAAYEAVVRRHEECYMALVAKRDAHQRAIKEKLDQESAQSRAARDRRRKKRTRLSAVALTIIVAAALLWALVIAPNARYGEAMDLMRGGSYQEAAQAFQAMNGYRSSGENLAYCRAMEGLQQGDYQAALANIGGAGTLKGQLRQAVADWRASAIAPHTLLGLLAGRAAFDPEGQLDADALSRQAHLEMAGGDGLVASRFEDADGDGREELVTLDGDCAVRLYQMTELDNRELPLDAQAQAGYLLSFGGALQGAGDLAGALPLYQRAAQLCPTDDGLQALSGVYLELSRREEANGDLAQALAYARQGLEAWDSRGSFERVYQLALDALAPLGSLEALDQWAAFTQGQARRLTAYGWTEQAQAQLGKCVDRLFKGGGDLPPERAFALLNLAARLGVAVEERESIYRQAALCMAGADAPLLDHRFVDWGRAGEPQLLALTGDGALVRYGLEGDDFALRQKEDVSDVSGPAFGDVSAQRVLIEGGAPDVGAFKLYVWDGQALALAVGESDAYAYKRDGAIIHYGSKLPGSIHRVALRQVDMDQPLAGPATTGITYQQDDYPQPQSAQQLVLRYLEARSYGIQGEQRLLVGGDGPLADGMSFTQSALDDIPTPQAPFNGRVQPYYLTQDGDGALVYARYLADGGQGDAFFSAAKVGGAWRLSGACLRPAEPVGGGDVLCLNQQADGALDAERSYTLLVPMDAQINIAWQRLPTSAPIGCRATLYMDSGDAFVSYGFQGTDERQTSSALFLPAGMYTLALKAEGQVDYSLLVSATPNAHMEREPNGDFASATPIACNAPIDAALHVKDDADFFLFTLDEASDVQLVLDGDSRADYAVDLYVSANDSARLMRAQAHLEGAAVKSEATHLRPGKYYVAVRAGENWSGAPYALTVQAHSTQIGEWEYNNRPDYAAPLPLNQELLGGAAYQGDVDVFLMALPAAGQMSLTFEALDAIAQYQLSVSRDGQQLWSGSVSQGGQETFLAYLAAADYQFTVTNERVGDKVMAQAPQRGYRIMAQYRTDENAESEPNDTVAQANVLPPNGAMTGNLITPSDIDIFRVTLEEPGMLCLALAADPVDGVNTRFDMAVASSDLTVLTQGALAQNADRFAAPQLFLDAGDYYVQINRGKAWDGGQYQLSAQFEPDAFAEREPNDTAQRATPLPLGQAVRGSFGTAQDKDWYVLTLAQDGAFSLALSMEQGGARMTVAQGDGKTGLWRGEFSQAGQSPELMLPAGQYYVLLESVAGGGDSYRLTAKFDPTPNIEREPNDSVDEANPLSFGVAVRGSMPRKSDVDCYRFTLPQAGVVKLSLAFPEPGEGAFALELCQDGKALWHTDVPCGQALKSYSLQMEGGTYEIVLKPSKWTSGSYEISIE